MSEVFELPEDRAVSIAAALFRISPKRVKSKCRDATTAHARFVAYHLLREDGMTVTAIAEYFARDHTAICHGLRRAKDLTTGDRRFAAIIKSACDAFLVLTPV